VRITILNPVLDLSGGGRVQSTHWSYLADRGHDVLVVSLPHPAIDWVRVAKDFLRGRGLPDLGERKQSHWNPRLQHRLLESRRPVAAADVPDADIIIGTWWETVEWLWALPASKGIKTTFVQGHEIFSAGSDSKIRARIEATYRLPMKRIAVSGWLQQILAESYDQHDVVVVPNAVDHDHFKAAPRARRRVPTVGFVYASAAFKGSGTVIDAIAVARRSIPNLKVIAFSSEKPRKDAGLPEGIELHVRPPQSEIPRLYASVDVWLWASTNDGFGLPILEAMSCGTPVIATPIGAARELCNAGGGTLVDVGDARAMAQAILRYCTSSEAEWQECSRAASRHAATYDWKSSLERMEKTLLSYVVP
jgi:glycosyltransferase involved in cell wall biosynthesis